MSNTEFKHTDRDGDTLKVWGGGSGAVIEALGDESMVAVNFDALPKLIETLQAILAEEQGESPKKQDDEELTVYGYMVVGRDGKATHGGDDLLTQQEAIDNATEWTKDAQDAGIDWDYRVAAIVDQGGL